LHAFRLQRLDDSLAGVHCRTLMMHESSPTGMAGPNTSDLPYHDRVGLIY
jgi:hypothetical protein